MRIFNEINLRHIRGDIFGGVTAAVIAKLIASDPVNGMAMAFHVNNQLCSIRLHAEKN